MDARPLAAQIHRMTAANLDLAVAADRAAESMRRFNDGWRRAEEAEFLEIVVHYDE